LPNFLLDERRAQDAAEINGAAGHESSPDMFLPGIRMPIWP
jgi:hypothetical protein